MKKKGEQKLVKFLFGKAKEFCERLKLSLFKKGRPKVYYFLKLQITLPYTTDLENLDTFHLRWMREEKIRKVKGYVR